MRTCFVNDKLARDRKEALWKTELLEKIGKMSNSDLFYNTLDAQIPDDYDGAFTARGDVERQIYIDAVCKRLVNWLAK